MLGAINQQLLKKAAKFVAGSVNYSSLSNSSLKWEYPDNPEINQHAEKLPWSAKGN